MVLYVSPNSIVYEFDDPNSLGGTMQFYLWTALLQPLPGEVERAVIDNQVNEICDTIEEQFDGLLKNPRLVPVGEKCALEFKRKYDLLKDNRLIPYFKRGWLNHQKKKNMDRMVSDFRRVGGSFHKYLRFRVEVGSDLDGAAYRDEQRKRVGTLKNKVWLSAAHYDGPLFRWNLPGAKVTGMTGKTNYHGIYVFRITAARPFGDFPLTPITDKIERERELKELGI